MRIESKETMTDQKTKFRRLVAYTVRRDFFGDYKQAAQAAAKVAKCYPQFLNIKESVSAEFANETPGADMPSPIVLKAAVAREQKASGLSYDESFRAVLSRDYPAAEARITLENEGEREAWEDSKAASKEFNDLLDAYFKDHPFRDRNKGPDWTYAFNAVAKANPNVMARMWTPGKTPFNRWQGEPVDGHAKITVPSKPWQKNTSKNNTLPPYEQPVPSGRKMPNSPGERARRAVPQGEPA
jgi:hypothetical protein